MPPSGSAPARWFWSLSGSIPATLFMLISPAHVVMGFRPLKLRSCVNLALHKTLQQQRQTKRTSNTI
eukprot:1899901-Amphidinium_carterae.1